MPIPESPKRGELRKVLRALTSPVAGLKEHEFELNQGRVHNISILPMDLDKNVNFDPTFFAPCRASLLLEPDDSYDKRAPPGFYEFDPNDTMCSRPIDCVLVFSFMGPQRVRLVEAYFDGSSVVVRPPRLFDLRKKDEAVIKELGQWYFGEPIGNTKECL
ncbi:hypothetical protein BDV41DRAFT_566004 [Aspergillus transmontanensis]|uniref:Uncharacterized protein n=1 Tax=Aspergillus transmontanensis TaxID=1034304 RepID=A0A5N6VSH6_9EURO|nr:hypothetical protein BDV41DRAFT_566004 [Aspergillus transmontanensis]